MAYSICFQVFPNYLAIPGHSQYPTDFAERNFRDFPAVSEYFLTCSSFFRLIRISTSFTIFFVFDRFFMFFYEYYCRMCVWLFSSSHIHTHTLTLKCDDREEFFRLGCLNEKHHSMY